jgi:CheY-like chemotaxis protein
MINEEKLQQILLNSQLEFLKNFPTMYDEATKTFFLHCYDSENFSFSDIKKFFHTIKGTSGTLQLNEMAKIAADTDAFISEKFENTWDLEPSQLPEIYFFISTNFALIHNEFLELKNTLDKDNVIPASSFDKVTLITPEQKDSTSTNNTQGKNSLTKETKDSQDASLPAELSHSILIIDSNTELHTLVSEIFENDYSIYYADSETLATDYFKKYLPEIILIDLDSSNWNGFDLSKQLKKLSSLNTKIVIVSQNDDPDFLIDAFELGIDDFITKPIIPDELEIRLTRL